MEPHRSSIIVSPVARGTGSHGQRRETMPLTDGEYLVPPSQLFAMTRTHKVNSINHQAIAEGLPRPQNIPKFFGKSGFADTNPKKTKKNGGGKGNWGSVGDEVIDDAEFNFTNARRRSNSSSFSNHMRDMRTKFDINETEPVFEEAIHGPEDEDIEDKSESGSSTGA